MVSIQRTSEVSTHSRPKAAGENVVGIQGASEVSTHSRPKAAGSTYTRADIDRLFQHTAARRRLGDFVHLNIRLCMVSTHSRPKAAGQHGKYLCQTATLFQHTAARRRLEPLLKALLHQVSQP